MIARRPLDLRRVLAWALYDFANSAFAAVIVATIYSAYYALGGRRQRAGAGDLWWGRVVSVSMALVALTLAVPRRASPTAPGVRRPLFIGFTALSVTATALMATVEPGMIVWGFVLGVLGHVGFEGALVYYNAYLPEIAPPRLPGPRVRLGLRRRLRRLHRRAALPRCPSCRRGHYGGAFLATAALFARLRAAGLLPPARSRPGGGCSVRQAAREGGREALATARRILARPDLRRFLGAYFVYEDGVNTVIAFSAIFAAQTLGFPMDRLIVLYIVVQISALAGALAWALADRPPGPARGS